MNNEPLNIIRWVITAWHCVWAEVHEGIMPVWMVAVVVGVHNKSSCVKYDRENTKYILSIALALYLIEFELDRYYYILASLMLKKLLSIQIQ